MTVRHRDPRHPPHATPGPRPAAVRHNDWRQVELAEPGAFAATLPVSVIVPCYEAPEALALTLAGLERQAWPPGLLEVVVVDDGSDPPLARPARTPLKLKVARQERCGFGLARARNTGVRAAAHDILVFLDGDVIAEAGLVAAHARWHHVLSDALTLGFCACVSVAGIGAGTVRAHRGPLGELLAGRPADPPWLERHMARTGDLTSRHGDLFRAVTGQNFGISRALYEEIGGFDESFTRYGGEDTEFAWRAQVHGALLVPERGAFGWHQGRWATGREAKERDLALQADKLAGLIAEPGFRQATGRRFAVPRHVVTLYAGRDDAGRAIEAARTLLFDPADDVALCIGVPPGRGGHPARQRLEQAFGEDPRVRIAPAGGALEVFPASPLHIALPAGAVTGPGLPARLAAALGDAAAANAVLEDGGRCRSHVPGLCTGRAAPAARPRTTAMCAGCRPGRCAAAGSARAALPGRDPRAGRHAGAARGPFSRGFGLKRPMCAGRARCGDSFAGSARARAGSSDRAAAGRRRPAAIAPRGPIRRSGPPSRFWDPAPGPSSPPRRGSATRPTARRRTRRWPTAQSMRRASGPR